MLEGEEGDINIGGQGIWEPCLRVHHMTLLTFADIEVPQHMCKRFAWCHVHDSDQAIKVE